MWRASLNVLGGLMAASTYCTVIPKIISNFSGPLQLLKNSVAYTTLQMLFQYPMCNSLIYKPYDESLLEKGLNFV
jgi:hypothetical protein